MSRSIQTMLRDLRTRRGRERRGLATAEGVRLLEEALAAGVRIRAAVVSPALEGSARGKALKAALIRTGVPLHPVTDAVLAELADTEHPQGIVAAIEPRRWGWADLRLRPGTTLLALDAVQDPGNVGTILRTALALGAGGVVALKGTAELHNPKVIRGSMGALFRLPSFAATEDEFLQWSVAEGVELWVADVAGDPVDRLPRGSGAQRPRCLILGNEGAGVSPTLAERAHRRVGIRLAGGVESLNVAVAAAILLYEVTRDR